MRDGEGRTGQNARDWLGSYVSSDMAAPRCGLQETECRCVREREELARAQGRARRTRRSARRSAGRDDRSPREPRRTAPARMHVGQPPAWDTRPRGGTSGGDRAAVCTVRGLGSAPASFRVDTAAAEHWQDESRRAGTIVRELRLPALGTAMRRNGACVYLRLPALRGLVYSSALNGCWIHGRNANVRASLDSSSHSGRFCVYRTVVSQENESVSSCSGAEPGSLF